MCRGGSDLVVLVINAEPLSQVSEHHGAVLFKLKAARQVLSGRQGGNKDHSGAHVTVRRHTRFHFVDTLLRSLCIDSRYMLVIRYSTIAVYVHSSIMCKYKCITTSICNFILSLFFFASLTIKENA